MDFSIQLRILAADSSWNDAVLINVYRSRLSSDIQTELWLSTSISTFGVRLSAIRCRQRDQPQREPSPEPMQLGESWLTARERRHRLTAGLCLYCGEAGHYLAECPTKRDEDQVTSDTHSSHTQFLVDVMLNVTNPPVSLSVLIDSGSAGNFISSSLVSDLALSVEEMAKPISVRALDGQSIVGNSRDVFAQCFVLVSRIYRKTFVLRLQSIACLPFEFKERFFVSVSVSDSIVTQMHCWLITNAHAYIGAHCIYFLCRQAQFLLATFLTW